MPSPRYRTAHSTGAQREPFHRDSPLPFAALTLAPLFLCVLVASGFAQSTAPATPAESSRSQALSWLFGPPSQSAARLQRLLSSGTSAPDAAALQATDSLEPGYHRITLPGWNPPLLYVVLVPKAQTFDGVARPALLTSPPGGKAPDEAVLRSIFGGALEAGFVVISPVPPLQHGYSAPNTQERSAFRAPGRTLLNKIVADAHRRVRFDRERVLFVNKFYPTTGDNITLDGTNIDLTPFAGSLWICPLNTRIRLPVSPQRWASRWMLALHGENPSERLLRRLRSAGKSPFNAEIKLVAHPGLNWVAKFFVEADTWRGLLSGVQRSPQSSRTEVHAVFGSPHPLRHEWVEVSRRERAVALRVQHRGNQVTITTPQAKGIAPFEMDLYLSHPQAMQEGAQPALNVQWNGRALSPEAVQSPVAERTWRRLKFSVLSGRTCDSYVAIRPR